MALIRGNKYFFAIEIYFFHIVKMDHHLVELRSLYFCDIL